MDTTALFSDVVLPAASYYEKVDISTTDCHSYMHPFNKVLDPLFDTKTDWEIFRALAEKMARTRSREGSKPFHDRSFDWHRDFTKAYDWTGKGAIPAADEEAANFILGGRRRNQGHDLPADSAAPAALCNRSRGLEQRNQGGRGLHAVQASGGKEAPVAHPYGPAAVLHRPSLVPRIR